MTTELTREQRDELLRTLYPTHPARVVSNRTGMTEAQVYRAALRMGLRRDIEHRTDADPVRKTILSLAAQPDGARFAEVVRRHPDTTLKAITTRVVKMRAAGLLFTADAGTRNARHFTSFAAAQAYQRRLAPKAAATVTISSSAGRGPAHLPGEPLITPRTRITIAPTPPRALRTNTHMVAG